MCGKQEDKRQPVKGNPVHPLVSSGVEEGSVCGRNECKGIIAVHPVVNCSCHLNPPCSACTSPRNYCPVCDWEEVDDVVINDFVVNVDKKTGTYKMWTPRLLDHTKIDWRSKSHTHFSMIKEGVYPEGTTRAEVQKKVNGTFGGRFILFGNGKFEFVAYTD